VRGSVLHILVGEGLNYVSNRLLTFKESKRLEELVWIELKMVCIIIGFNEGCQIVWGILSLGVSMFQLIVKNALLCLEFP
jgi:hypothetical protein